MSEPPDHGRPAGPPRPDLDVAASLRLPADPAGVARARRFVTDFCSASGLPAEVCQTAALLVSELVANAVLHGRTSATIVVHRPADTLRVSVRDDNPQLPAIGQQPTLEAEHGRGLHIVSMLAPRWGIDVADGGKAVWFELEVTEPD